MGKRGRQSQFVADCLNRCAGKGLRIEPGRDSLGMLSSEIVAFSMEKQVTIPISDEAVLALASMARDIFHAEHELVEQLVKCREAERRWHGLKTTFDAVMSAATNRDVARELEAVLEKITEGSNGTA